MDTNKKSAGEGSCSPHWWSLSFTPLPGYDEQVTRLLFAAGCSGIWESDKGDNQLVKIAYFPAECYGEITDLCRRLAPFLVDRDDVVVEKVGRENWMEAWREYFKPVNLTPAWMVMPPWWPAAGQQSRQIIIYPGMAFGTGTHETTRLAATLLEKVLKSGNSVLDMGTGSAILAILARKLGAGHILAVDSDEDALENAAQNCRLNNCDHAIRLSSGDLAGVDEKFDLVVANIIAPVLVELAPQLIKKMNSHGQLILSGILTEQLEMVRGVYEAGGVFLEQQLAEGEWVALRCRA